MLLMPLLRPLRLVERGMGLWAQELIKLLLLVKSKHILASFVAATSSRSTQVFSAGTHVNKCHGAIVIARSALVC